MRINLNFFCVNPTIIKYLTIIVQYNTFYQMNQLQSIRTMTYDECICEMQLKDMPIRDDLLQGPIKFQVIILEFD